MTNDLTKGHVWHRPCFISCTEPRDALLFATGTVKVKQGPVQPLGFCFSRIQRTVELGFGHFALKNGLRAAFTCRVAHRGKVTRLFETDTTLSGTVLLSCPEWGQNVFKDALAFIILQCLEGLRIAEGRLPGRTRRIPDGRGVCAQAPARSHSSAPQQSALVLKASSEAGGGSGCGPLAAAPSYPASQTWKVRRAAAPPRSAGVRLHGACRHGIHLPRLRRSCGAAGGLTASAQDARELGGRLRCRGPVVRTSLLGTWSLA